MNLPPLPELPPSPESRLRWLAWGEEIESRERYIIELLVAAGHVTEAQVAKAREIAAAIRNETTAEVPATRA